MGLQKFLLVLLFYLCILLFFMVSDSFFDKPKIFIRYPPGGSGNFIALLVYSLIKDNVTLRDPYYAHAENPNTYGLYHNWNNQHVDMTFLRYIKSADSNLDQAKTWIQNNYNFYTTPDSAYVAHTHAEYPDAIMLSCNNSKLINIVFDNSDCDQLAYNWIKKCYINHRSWAIVNGQLEFIKTKYNKLLDIPSKSMNNQTDIKLLTYIQRYATENYNVRYQTYQPRVDFPKFDINFTDIASKKIIDILNNLIEFLNIPVTDKRKTNAVGLINRYADAQIPVPWKLNINEYN